jgi:hypothetical protein
MAVMAPSANLLTATQQATQSLLYSSHLKIPVLRHQFQVTASPDGPQATTLPDGCDGSINKYVDGYMNTPLNIFTNGSCLGGIRSERRS